MLLWFFNVIKTYFILFLLQHWGVVDDFSALRGEPTSNPQKEHVLDAGTNLNFLEKLIYGMMQQCKLCRIVLRMWTPNKTSEPWPFCERVNVVHELYSRKQRRLYCRQLDVYNIICVLIMSWYVTSCKEALDL